MISVGVRELKNNLSRHLRRLKPGEVVAVTDRGRTVAELRSATGGPSGLTPVSGGYARLLAEGVIGPARERGDPLGALGAGRVPAVRKGTVEALMHEDRGD